MNETIHASNGLACEGGTPLDRRNKARILWISVVWAACLIGASYSIRHDLVPAGPIAWLVALVPTIAGVIVLLIYSRYLRETDELQQVVQLRALALGFGAGWIALAGYPLLERLGAPAAHASEYVVVMAIFFSIGNVIGWRQYR